MLYHEKAEVISQCIKEIKKWNWLKNWSIHSWLLLAIETLEDLHTETIALAEQEAERMREEVTDPTDDKLMKNGTYLENAVNNWEIKNVVMIPVGVPGAYQEYTEEEMYKHEQIQK